MASGSFSVSTSNDHVVGSVKWSSTKDISSNSSSVKATMYLSRNNSGYTTYGTGDFFVTINGTKVSANNKDFTITYNSNTVMVSGTVNVTHNSDGTKTIIIGWGGDSNVFNVNDSSGSATLDDIPRASSLTSSASWTAGNNITLSISRASSSFTHTAKIYTNGSLLRTETNIGTSRSINFSQSENTTIFNQINGGSSVSTKITLITYDGSKQVGSKDYTGNVTAPSASTAKITNPTGVSSASGQGNSTVYIDQDISISISRNNSDFTHTIKFKDANSGSVLHTATGVTTSYTWTPTQTEMNNMYNKIPNSIEFDGQIDVYTYYNGVQVRSSTDTDINYRVRNSNPTFNGAFTYKDTNATTSAITGNDQYIVQNNSTLQVTIPVASKATAINGATMSSYSVTVNGKTVPGNYSSTSDVVITFGTVDAASDLTMTVKAIDSRGLSTSQTKTVRMLGYQSPTVNSSLSRLNGFDSQTTLSSDGSFSLLDVDGTNKNTIKFLQYRYKTTTSSTWSDWIDLAFTVTYPNFASTDITLDLDSLKSWNVDVKVTDSISSAIVSNTVNRGRPIFFIDTSKNSMGFNDFPTNPNEFMINGRIVFGANIWSDDTSQGETGGGALYLNNSDITGVNALMFGDVSNDNNGEGLLFLKSGKTSDSNDKFNDYDNFYVRDGVGYLNALPMFNANSKVLWEGAMYMQDGQTLNVPKKLSQCPNGWMLVWCKYVSGVTQNNDFNLTFVPKGYIEHYNGVGMWTILQADISTQIKKYIYISDDHITGNSQNTTSPNDMQVLKAVLMV